MNLEIANRLVELRKQNNLSQEELAARLGVSRQAVSKWERGESSPDTDNLIALARLYGVSLDGLLLNPGPAAARYATAPEPPPEPEPEEPLWTQEDEDAAIREAARRWDAAEEAPRRARWARIRRGFLVFPYPVLVTAVFLLIGFSFGAWHPGWMIFLTIPIYYTVFGTMK